MGVDKFYFSGVLINRNRMRFFLENLVMIIAENQPQLGQNFEVHLKTLLENAMDCWILGYQQQDENP